MRDKCSFQFVAASATVEICSVTSTKDEASELNALDKLPQVFGIIPSHGIRPLYGG